MRNSAFALTVLLLGGLSASGCAHAHARTVGALPPLDVPAPPPRVVETTDTEAPPPIGLIQEPGRNLPPTAVRPATPAPAKAEAPKPDTPKPEAAAPPPVDGPKAADEAPKVPAATLQTTTAQQEGEVEGKIRAALGKASADLNRIDYSRLNSNARTQYDSAKRFVSLAEDALRTKNLVYAQTLADKAAELADQLPGK